MFFAGSGHAVRLLLLFQEWSCDKFALKAWDSVTVTDSTDNLSNYIFTSEIIHKFTS